MKLLDLFSGIGGFHLGLTQSSFEFDWVGFSEIDKYATQLYKQRFPKGVELGNITTIRPETLPEIDICTFGFPCQDLSIAGKRGGIKAARSGLFFEAMRIIRVKRPKYIIFENVKGLFSSNGGRDFIAVLKEIADAGYDGQWQLLNTRWFLPQNRERIFFVGHIRGARRPKIFPIGESTQNIENNGQQGKRLVVGLDSNYHKGADGKRTMIQIGNIDQKGHNSIWGRVYNPEGDAVSLNAKGGGMGAKTGLYAVSPCIRAEHHNTADVHFIEQKGRGFNKGGKKDICPPLTSNAFEQNNFVSGIRRLTPTECERLQGFPDGWTDGLSDTQKYKCLGNAVSVPIVKSVGERLKELQ